MKIYIQVKKRFLKNFNTFFKNLNESLENIKELKRLMIIMGKKQDKVNQQAEQMVALGTEILDMVNTLKNSIEAETAQIDQFVAGLPENVDTTVIDNALDRLEEAFNSTQDLNDKVSGIFTPAQTGGEVTPSTPVEPTPVEPAPPVDDDTTDVTPTTPETPVVNPTEPDIPVTPETPTEPETPVVTPDTPAPVVEEPTSEPVEPATPTDDSTVTDTNVDVPVDNTEDTAPPVEENTNDDDTGRA